MASSSGLSKSAQLVATNQHTVRMLMHEFQELQKEPMEGFRVKLLKDENIFEWEVALFGPPDTLYAGGYFRAIMKFPQEYPFAPPSVRFVTKLWHPNVYENGTVCISILHPPTDDPRSGELPCERWNPTQNVHSVLMSIISLLNEPNTSSPANVDASIMYRKYKEKGDKEYERVVKDQVEASKAEAIRDNVAIPMTVEEYCVTRKTKSDQKNTSGEFADFGPSDDEDEQLSPYSFSSDEPALCEDLINNADIFGMVGKRKESGDSPDRLTSVPDENLNKRQKPEETQHDRS